jgi:hypothetical protein
MTLDSDNDVDIARKVSQEDEQEGEAIPCRSGHSSSLDADAPRRNVNFTSSSTHDAAAPTQGVLSGGDNPQARVPPIEDPINRKSQAQVPPIETRSGTNTLRKKSSPQPGAIPGEGSGTNTL